MDRTFLLLIFVSLLCSFNTLSLGLDVDTLAVKPHVVALHGLHVRITNGLSRVLLPVKKV